MTSTRKREIARSANMKHFAALLAGNFALVIGAWLIRPSNSGPVSAAFWRLLLPLPLLALVTRREREPFAWVDLGNRAAMVLASGVFAFGFAS